MSRERRVKKFYKNDRVGIYVIKEYIGIRNNPNNKKKPKDYVYKVKCKRCGAERQIRQRSLDNPRAYDTIYCRKCPTKDIIEARKERKEKYSSKRFLKDEEIKLFRLAIFGKQ